MAGGYYGFGAALGGLSDGFERGMRIGDKLRERKERREVADAYKSGMEGAKADREAAIEGGITREAPDMNPMGPPNPAAGGIDPMGPPAPTFKVGEQSFGKKADARKASEGETDSVENFFLKSYAPSIKDIYIKQGNLEKAEQFESWMQAKGTREGLKGFMGAIRAANMQDRKGFAKHLKDAYNAPGYHDDGLTVTDATPITDEKGGFGGYAVKFKNNAGQTFEQTYQGGEDLYPMMLTMLAPEKGFELFHAERAVAKKSALDASNKAADRAEKNADDKERAAYESKLRMQEDQFKELIKTPPNQRDEKWAIDLDERRDRILTEQNPTLPNGLKYNKASTVEKKAFRDEEARQNGWVINAGRNIPAARPNPAAGGLPPLQPVR